MTPLHYAVDRSFRDVATFLIDNGAQLDAQDTSGETPLMIAVLCEHEELLKLLLDRGADKSIRNCEGLTVLELCGIKEEISSILISWIVRVEFI